MVLKYFCDATTKNTINSHDARLLQTETQWEYINMLCFEELINSYPPLALPVLQRKSEARQRRTHITQPGVIQLDFYRIPVCKTFYLSSTVRHQLDISRSKYTYTVSVWV